MEKYLVHEIINYWRGAYKVLEEDWKRSAEEQGITPAEQHVLWILYFEKEATMTRIGDVGLWEVTTVMQLITRLKSKGLVKVFKNDLDRRVSYVSLTENGEELRRNSGEHTFRLFEYLYSILEEEGQNEVVIQMHSFLKRLNKEFHGCEFVDWVESTSSSLKEQIDDSNK